MVSAPVGATSATMETSRPPLITIRIHQTRKATNSVIFHKIPRRSARTSWAKVNWEGTLKASLASILGAWDVCRIGPAPFVLLG